MTTPTNQWDATAGQPVAGGKPALEWDMDAAAQMVAALTPLTAKQRLHTLAVVIKVFIEGRLPEENQPR